MRRKKDKGPLRNFRFLKEADNALLLEVNETGRDMTTIIERKLLNRSQHTPAEPKTLDSPREQNAETASAGLPARVAVDEAGALAMLNLNKREPAAAKKAFWRFRRMFNIKTLPGGVYSVRAIERAST